MKNKLQFFSLLLTMGLFASCMAQPGAQPNPLMSFLPLILIGIIVFAVVKTRKKNAEKIISVDAGKTKSEYVSQKVAFAIYGGILGIPLSYYFQSEMVKNKVGGIGGYLKNFGQIVDNSDLLANVIISVIIFAIIGGVIGYFVDENEAKKTK
jgi:cobalamin biosynthesis protein CobD/CbiB